MAKLRRRGERLRGPVVAVAAAATAATSAGIGAGPARAAAAHVGSARAAAASPATPQVRVNQVGYSPRSPKTAFAMLPRPVRSVSFVVSGIASAAGHPRLVFRSRSAADVGRWNSGYRAVYRLDFSAVTVPGTYRISVRAAGSTALSPSFRIARSAALYDRLVANSVRYFTSQRDGANVVSSVLSRQPANLTDRRAFVYRAPRFDSNSNLVGAFHRIGGPVNAIGGWFDAGGGYEKFAYTTSYTDGLMLLAARDFSARYPTLKPEADFGLRWLRRLWSPARKVLYMQVGVGTGNASNTIQGDYNFWFLPQAEDRLNVKPGSHPGPSAYYVRYRPVFAAAPPGQKMPPDFAGRLAADFALGAQQDARRRPGAARHLLALARGVYAMAKTSHVGSLLTAYPHAFYPGSQWKSDMLWGAAEIALADEALHAPAPRVRADLAVAARWAVAYIAQGHPAGGDTFNLYDTGAVAEAELLQAMHQAPGGHPMRPRVLLSDLAAQLRVGEAWAKGDPFALGAHLGPADAAPHAFGLFVTNALYQRYGGSDQFQAFAQQQLNFALGGNAWGTTFVVGAGHTFPHCMQSEIANLSGSLTGRGAIQLGATTDGPSTRSNFTGLGTVSGMRACHAGHFAPFDTRSVGYEDNVVAWPSVEPALDYSADSFLAFVLAAHDHPRP